MDMLICRASAEKRLQNQRESYQSGEDHFARRKVNLQVSIPSKYSLHKK